MMRLEYLASEAIIRLSGFGPADAGCLRDACTSLSRGDAAVSLHHRPWVNAVGGIQLSMLVKHWHQGILAVGPLAFEWALTAAEWDNVAGLIEPFSVGDRDGYQWLSQGNGEVEVLLSLGGQW